MTKFDHVRATEESVFTFIDLFAGLGGFHVALAGLGGRAVFAAEWVRPLAELYERNYGVKPIGDITEQDPKLIPDHTILTAGFPCQPFSKAGEQLGFEHTEQGQLFFSVRDILKEKRPPFFVLENVPNILRHRNGATIATIYAELEALGYAVDHARLSPHDFGVPQIRERVYIVGSLHGLEGFNWPSKEKKATDIRDVLDTQPADARALSATALNCISVWDRFIKAAPDGFQLPSFPLWAMEFQATYPFESETPFGLTEERAERGLAGYRGSFGVPLDGLSKKEQLDALPSHARRPQYQFPEWKKQFIRQNRKFYQDNRSWIDPILPAIKKFPSSFQKFEWNAKGEERDMRNFVIQFRASGVRVKRPTTAPSLVAMTDTQVPIIGWEGRYMTPRECARLQSLDHIELPEKRADAYKALGNAVNARVVAKIAEHLLGIEAREALPGAA